MVTTLASINRMEAQACQVMVLETYPRLWAESRHAGRAGDRDNPSDHTLRDGA